MVARGRCGRHYTAGVLDGVGDGECSTQGDGGRRKTGPPCLISDFGWGMKILGTHSWSNRF